MTAPDRHVLRLRPPTLRLRRRPSGASGEDHPSLPVAPDRGTPAVTCTHAAPDDREELSKAIMLAELDRLERPFDRDADPTHFTASAIVTGDRGVVLHRHRRLHRWLQPGGTCRPGRTAGRCGHPRVRRGDRVGGGPSAVRPGADPPGRAPVRPGPRPSGPPLPGVGARRRPRPRPRREPGRGMVQLGATPPTMADDALGRAPSGRRAGCSTDPRSLRAIREEEEET